jgi:hypothetical protein
MIDNRKVHISTHYHQTATRNGIGLIDLVVLVLFWFPVTFMVFGPKLGPLVWLTFCFIGAGRFGRYVIGVLAAIWLFGMLLHPVQAAQCYWRGSTWVCQQQQDNHYGEVGERYQPPRKRECYYRGRTLICTER